MESIGVDGSDRRYGNPPFNSARERNINILCCGEEDLLGKYLLSMTDKGRGFTLPDEPINGLFIEAGIWKHFLESPQRAAQIGANEESYFWDYLIEKFCKNILAGTSYDRVTPFIADRERAVRMLALEPRTHRRVLARGLIELLRRTAPNVRATRVGRPDGTKGPYFCFLLLPRYASIPIDTYREARGQNLDALLRATKLMYPDALDIIGFATESGRAQISGQKT